MLLLVLGDIIALYVSLLGTLFVRYGVANFETEFFEYHLAPFSLIFTLWILVFYIAGLYDLRHLRNSLEFFKTLALTLVTNALLTVVLFYLVPSLGISPKTNLFLFLVFFTILETFWRGFWNRHSGSSETLNKVVLVDGSASASEIAETLVRNPQLGYGLAKVISQSSLMKTPGTLRAEVEACGGNLVVVDWHLKQASSLNRELYSLLRTGIEVRDIPSFYESVFKKIPLNDIEESWILEHLADQERFYDPLKHGFEFCAALFLFIVLLPIEVLIAVLILLTSPTGPAVCSQTRIGYRGKPYTHYKFRTMHSCREKEQAGAKWKTLQGGKIVDPRLTPFGKFLVHTHLDELPQLINILKGEMSFAGPRPERPEFVEVLKDQIPYYEARLLVRPGVTGWAQINYRYAASVEDTVEKLKYDIYYVKNRSLVIDIAIILRTLKTLFVTPK